MTFGNKFSASEVDDAFAEFKIDDGQIDAAHLKGLMVSKQIKNHLKKTINNDKNKNNASIFTTIK